ncbi:HAD family phosphatase [Candidatus Sulfidibacterium hydrothermale]|uniref:HAD family hydrolase n=1 Tax=Candidatus Sulfidibacterium hydrothermale TaxID=2875962 RepID=UPI001F0A72E1|nr:HAD family phosphatase [Candidatus Sulfidibacterium hydrothermale]UBM62133.1 HAD family phosphatase [Candidatus Sulfidibacterium hydrothermale]
MAEIENIIFDFGGVIIDIDPLLTIKALEKLGFHDIERLKTEEFYQKVIYKFEKGIDTPEVFRNKLRDYLQMNLSDQQLDDAWNALLYDIPEERIRIIEEVKKNYPVYLLSNSNEIHYDLYVRDLQLRFGYREFDELFSKAYFSFDLHLAKPHVEIYEFVIHHHRMDPEKTLFIDDRMDNIEGARRAGLKTFHLQPPQTIRHLFKNGKLKPGLAIQ